MQHWYKHQRIGTRPGELGNKKKSGEHQNYSIFEIEYNTEKGPGVLRRRAVTHWLTHCCERLERE